MLSGNLQNEHNFCYSPEAAMKIRINGQLLLLMLAEKLVQIGCKIVQANTDGLFLICKKTTIVITARFVENGNNLLDLL